MTTLVPLDLEEVNEDGDMLPASAIADFVSLTTSRRQLGVVLNLRKDRVLKKPVAMPVGPTMVTVRFPNGEYLSFLVEVKDDGERSGIDFEPSSHPEVDLPRTYLASEARAPRLPEVREKKTTAKGGSARFSPRAVSGETSGRAVLDLVQAISRDIENPRTRGFGLVRLQGSSEQDSSLKAFSSQALIRETQAVQPTNLKVQHHQLSAQWTVPIRYARSKGNRTPDSEPKRFFALSYVVEDRLVPQQVACIPDAWVLPDTTKAQIQVTYRDSEDGLRRKRMALEVEDPMLGSMIDYLQTGDLESAVALFKEAKEYLRDKKTNPFAAAAGGYVLLYSGIRDEKDVWAGWVKNLANWFTDLPDGMILWSTLLLQTDARLRGSPRPEDRADENREALDASLEAVRRGPPLFRMGLSLLMSNLWTLERLFKNDRDDLERIRKAMNYVQGLCLRADPSQAFSVFDVDVDEFAG